MAHYEGSGGSGVKTYNGCKSREGVEIPVGRGLAKEGVISQQLSILENSLLDLRNAVNELHKKLDPVLRSEPTASESNMKQPAIATTGVHLADRVTGSIGLVMTLGKEVNALSDLVEI